MAAEALLAIQNPDKASCLPSTNKCPVEETIKDLTDKEMLSIKWQAKHFKGQSTISNARAAIALIQATESQEEAKLFVRSLKPNY